jgi:hypothetical protein
VQAAENGTAAARDAQSSADAVRSPSFVDEFDVLPSMPCVLMVDGYATYAGNGLVATDPNTLYRFTLAPAPAAAPAQPRVAAGAAVGALLAAIALAGLAVQGWLDVKRLRSARARQLEGDAADLHAAFLLQRATSAEASSVQGSHGPPLSATLPPSAGIGEAQAAWSSRQSDDDDGATAGSLDGYGEADAVAGVQLVADGDVLFAVANHGLRRYSAPTMPVTLAAGVSTHDSGTAPVTSTAAAANAAANTSGATPGGVRESATLWQWAALWPLPLHAASGTWLLTAILAPPALGTLGWRTDEAGVASAWALGIVVLLLAPVVGELCAGGGGDAAARAPLDVAGGGVTTTGRQGEGEVGRPTLIRSWPFRLWLGRVLLWAHGATCLLVGSWAWWRLRQDSGLVVTALVCEAVGLVVRLVSRRVKDRHTHFWRAGWRRVE